MWVVVSRLTSDCLGAWSVGRQSSDLYGGRGRGMGQKRGVYISGKVGSVGGTLNHVGCTQKKILTSLLHHPRMIEYKKGVKMYAYKDVRREWSLR